MRRALPVVLLHLWWNSLPEVCSSSLFNEDVNNCTMTSRLILPEDYVKAIRPLGAPVIVNFNILVVDINSINVEDMDFRVDMFVSQSWIESRLNTSQDIFEEGDDYAILPPEFFDNLWQPDPYFLNSKVSVSYDRKKLRLKWDAGGVTVNPELKLLQYDIGKPMVFEETIDYMLEKNGNFSRLVVFFRFERQIGHHLIQTFAPSTLVVMLSWFSFWLDLDAIPGRIALLVTSMLTLVTMFTGLKSDIPPVAYIKALDVWMAGCMMFVFAALSEFVVVKVLDFRRIKNDTQSFMESCSFSRLMMKRQSVWNGEFLHASKSRNNPTNKHLLPTLWLDPECQIKQTCKTRSQQIDCYSRVVFPILFLLFVVLYWPIVLFKSAIIK
ncbi:glycine receptor subunit alphaZ1 isoform X4 [Solenopsis invicta]|uniref:glycine receptor subunit alphaZ1 isoform X4 n=1 Tax=Solenopsis invicta TaxID=13686 RepID=UPI000E34005A|nr:glycine receptor subunit alphaZ1 isoform X4 [Solenopsis invicta]